MSNNDETTEKEAKPGRKTKTITALLKSGVKSGDGTFVKISIILNLSKVISSLKNLTKMW